MGLPLLFCFSVRCHVAGKSMRQELSSQLSRWGSWATQGFNSFSGLSLLETSLLPLALLKKIDRLISVCAFVCVCVHTCVSLCVCMCPQRPAEGVRSPGTRLTGYSKST